MSTTNSSSILSSNVVEDSSNPSNIATLTQLINSQLHKEYNRLITYPLIWTIYLSKAVLSAAGFYYLGRGYQCKCFFCNIELNAEEYTTGSIEEIHSTLSPNCDIVNRRATTNIPLGSANQYQYEQHRLVSFLRVSWIAPVDPYDLAKWGFYYNGVGDVGRCHFCRLEVRGWEPGDQGESEHRRWNPACPFINNRQVGNIPLGQEAGGLLNTPTDRAAVHFLGEGPNPSAEQLGIFETTPPRHPQYAQTGARLSTYSLWPVSLTQRPEQLAEAGFYYTGRGDRVLCFQCGGGLKDWGPGDSPWVEHAVWFSQCAYLILKKGRTFIEQVQALREAQSASEVQQFNQSTVNPEQPSTENRPELVQHVVAESVHVEQPANQQQIEQRSIESNNTTGDSATEQEMNETAVDENSLRTCKVCFQKELGIVFLPCGHMATCPDCAPQLRNCPICRTVANAYVRAYLP